MQFDPSAHFSHDKIMWIIFFNRYLFTRDETCSSHFSVNDYRKTLDLFSEVRHAVGQYHTPDSKNVLRHAAPSQVSISELYRKIYMFTINLP